MKKTEDQLKIEIKAAEDAYSAFEIKSPADFQKSLELFKAVLELKGEENVKNFEEKMQAIEAAALEAKTAKDSEISEMKSKLDQTIAGFDALQIRIKNDSRIKKLEPETKSFVQAAKESLEEKTDDVNKFIKGEIKSFGIEIKAVADVSTANVTGSAVWGAVYKPGIITNPNQINHFRNFLNVVPGGPGTDYYFMKENGVGEGAPAPTAEKKAAAATNVATGLKPSFDVDLVEASVKFETIAGIMIASKKAMNNIPNFMNFINMRVPEKLLDVEDEQILYGDGVSPNLSGMLLSGNFTASTSTAATLAGAIIDDLATLEDTYKRIATGIFMRPKPLMEFFNQTAAGSGEYDLPKNFVFVGGQLYISGVPVYKSTAVHTGDYFIEAVNGADLVIQEGIRVEFFNQHASLAATNQIMIRVEETVALPLYGATYRIKGTVPA